MERKFLDIDNCIIIHDVKQIKKEPSEKKIKTKRQLSKILKKTHFHNESESAVYTKLYRQEKEGFWSEDSVLIKAILDTLEVTQEELIREFLD